MMHFKTLLLTALLCGAPLASAQDADHATLFVPTDELAGQADDELAAIAPMAREELLSLTIGLYATALAAPPIQDPGDCKTLARRLRGYIDEREAEIEQTVASLAGDVAHFTDEDLESLAGYLREGLFEHPTVDGGQRRIYECIKGKEATQGRRRPVSKQMSRFFKLHKPLLEAIAGPIDE